jgi:hypothetical protein
MGANRWEMGSEAHGRMNIRQIAADLFTGQLEKFSDRHAGETCYIFGDGPSIKWFDFSEFSNHPAICCGMIPFHRDFEKLDVRYIALVEPWLFVPKLFQPKILHGLRKIAAEYRKRIFRLPDTKFFVSLSNQFSLSGKNVNYVYRKLPNPRNAIDKQLNQFDIFGGSFHASLSLAYYMGFKKVYLVGFDAWTIQPARTLRWYELGDGEYFDPTNFALDYLNVLKPEIDIYTISKDGESCNVKNISYTSYTGKQPEFKENYELLSEHMLNTLATCNEYKIFSKSNQ